MSRDTLDEMAVRYLTGRPMREAETIGVNFARRRGIEGVDAAALAKLRALTVAEIVVESTSNAAICTMGTGAPSVFSVSAKPPCEGRGAAPRPSSA